MRALFNIVLSVVAFATIQVVVASPQPEWPGASRSIKHRAIAKRSGKSCSRRPHRPSSVPVHTSVAPSATKAGDNNHATSSIKPPVETTSAGTSGSNAPAPPAASHVSSPPPSTPAPSSSDISGTVSSSDIQRYLNAHNSVRAQHDAAPLAWNNTLEAAAQKWANNCKFQHSGGTLGPFGENLAAGSGGMTIEAGIALWANEASQYNAGNPQPSHFTQMVWKGSSQVGCAVQSCAGIFAASFGNANFYVCEYFPAGNVIGQFAQNVDA